jgi:peroxiredoxin Q/BCP
MQQMLNRGPRLRPRPCVNVADQPSPVSPRSTRDFTKPGLLCGWTAVQRDGCPRRGRKNVPLVKVLNPPPTEVNLTEVARKVWAKQMTEENGSNEVEMVANLDVGDLAPDFDLPTDNGRALKLSALRGKIVVLFFYPKDDTTGCTAEAVAFNRLRRRFAEAGAKIVGLSPDGVKSHARFKLKHKLAVTLVADPERAAIGPYDVWREKSMYGRKYMGVERTTAIIGPDGRILRLWRKVKVPGHAEEALAAVEALGATFANH